MWLRIRAKFGLWFVLIMSYRRALHHGHFSPGAVLQFSLVLDSLATKGILLHLFTCLVKPHPPGLSLDVTFSRELS